jgi:hypothetical protein
MIKYLLKLVKRLFKRCGNCRYKYQRPKNKLIMCHYSGLSYNPVNKFDCCDEWRPRL